MLRQVWVGAGSSPIVGITVLSKHAVMGVTNSGMFLLELDTKLIENIREAIVILWKMHWITIL